MDQETRTVVKIARHLLPLLMISYVLSYIDRINIGFAASTMNADIGLSAYHYGLGAGLFFWSYFLLEIPSNLILARVGARRWLFRIMFSWGCLSAGMAFVSSTTSFLALRVALGAAEAGFFPGVILYLNCWFPAAYRARIFAGFMVAIPLSLAIGAPLSAVLLTLEGLLGLHGWQWLFLLEALPTIILSFALLALLPDQPIDAKWLHAEERDWLIRRLATEASARTAPRSDAVLRIFVNPRLLALVFIYFANTTANLGLAFFLPQIVHDMGFAGLKAGLLTSIPYFFGVAGLLVIGTISDRLGERRWCLFAALLLSAAGLAASAWSGRSIAGIAFLSVAAVGIYGAKAPFWPLPTAYLSGNAAAAGIALVNAVGNLGGFVGPMLVGWAKQGTGLFGSGLLLLAGIAALATLLTLFVGPAAPSPTSSTELARV